MNLVAALPTDRRSLARGASRTLRRLRASRALCKYCSSSNQRLTALIRMSGLPFILDYVNHDSSERYMYSGMSL